MNTSTNIPIEFIFIVVLAVMDHAIDCSPTEDRLLSQLFGTYNTRTRPVLNDGDSVNVTLNIKIFQLLSVDEKQQNVEMSIWLRQSWKDPVSLIVS